MVLYHLIEAYFEVLPRLNEITFGSGVTDELLFLDLPREIRFPSGVMMLEYGRAVQESVYQQLHVVHEGQLRIVFSHDLKVSALCISWWVNCILFLTLYLSCLLTPLHITFPYFYPQ